MDEDPVIDHYSPPATPISAAESRSLGFRYRFCIASGILAFLLPLALLVLPRFSAGVSTLLLLAGWVSPAVWVLLPELRTGLRNVSAGRMALVMVGLLPATALMALVVLGVVDMALWLFEVVR
ncbi:hypothetical protein JI752_007935 [Lysobacter sp. MMG2]|uniref:hypothetical protein n=1 Tax=Lysobacter sp. MMG2 TaxID=2801338 RepID=UPI001C234582|nr:hypothetical protein [Lysobacter sp. MMG2]MBU8976074.1 hypothetical protein [Lysobacter sp. MMG2]